ISSAWRRRADSTPWCMTPCWGSGPPPTANTSLASRTSAAGGGAITTTASRRGRCRTPCTPTAPASPGTTSRPPTPPPHRAPPRRALAVAPGNRFTVQVAVFATNRPFDGELELAGVNLPQGVTLHAPKLTPGMTRVPVVFEAAPDAKPQAALIDLVARPVG